MAHTQRKLAFNPPANDHASAPATRLHAAIKSVEDAYAEQSRQVRHYQACNRELGATVQRLQKSMEAYLASLERINVSRLNRRSRRLWQIADGW